MDETKSGSIGWGGLLLFIVVIFILFGGNFLGGRGAVAGAIDCGCNRVSNCEIEKQEMTDAYNTQLNTINQGITTREAIVAGNNRLFDQSAAQYSAQKDEKIFDLKLANLALEEKLYSESKFAAISAQIADINCNMLKKPALYGIAATTCGQVVPPVFGDNCCGCN